VPPQSIAVCTVLNSWWWTEILSETCRVLFQKLIWEISKKVQDDLKDRRGYCQLKEEALDCTVWRNRFGGGFGPVVWQITNDDDDDHILYAKHEYYFNRKRSENKQHFVGNNTQCAACLKKMQSVFLLSKCVKWIYWGVVVLASCT